ncbi:hypothetical protein SBOR_6906 [Sclerotinia borealis F-4128]|uniref:Uncharacterized protein n=1 Tax=Sclerotinia borealis (strain F-4128) TaxID=1432307 RepID=W9CCZ2_SCLBF|nr:hypothetical protein SBOR_6906 [Sclerotinia borealis F-4128]
MSSQAFPLDPLLLQHDHNNNNNNPPQATAVIQQEQELKEKEQSDFNQEFENLNQTHLDNAPDFKNQEYQPDFERHVATASERGSIISKSSEPYSNHQQESYSVSTPHNLQPTYSVRRQSPDLGQLHSGGLSPQQQYENSLPQHQPFGSQQLDSQHYSSQHFASQSYDDQPFDGQLRSPHDDVPSQIIDSTLYPHLILEPYLLTMTLEPPPTQEELSFLESWIPRNPIEVDRFFAARPVLKRCGSGVPLREQIHHVVRLMLAEQGDTSHFDAGDLNDHYDHLGAILLGQYRWLNPEHADEIQRAAAQSTPAAAAASPPQSAGARLQSLAGRPSEHQPLNDVEADDEDAFHGTDTVLTKQWVGQETIVNRLGVVQERLEKRGVSPSVANKAHPEVRRLMTYPPSAGNNLSDHDVLQLVRLPPLQRHIRASKIFSARGEFYCAYRRFALVSDEELRREGLIRSWLPRCVDDRPANSVERAERAIALGLTGDHKLTADAAAERLRRAGLSVSRIRTRRRATRAARSKQAAETVGMATPSSSTAAVLGAET